MTDQFITDLMQIIMVDSLVEPMPLMHDETQPESWEIGDELYPVIYRNIQN